MKKRCATIAFLIIDYPSETMGNDSLTCVNVGVCIKVGENGLYNCLLHNQCVESCVRVLSMGSNSHLSIVEDFITYSFSFPIASVTG